jgi:hypothetical protein
VPILSWPLISKTWHFDIGDLKNAVNSKKKILVTVLPDIEATTME